MSLELLRVLAEYLVNLVLTQILPVGVACLLLVVIGNWVLRTIVRAVESAMRRGRVRQAQIDLAKAAIVATGWVMIIAGVLQTLGLNQIALAVGGTISLIALGLSTSASGSLNDIIAGIFLASDP